MAEEKDDNKPSGGRIRTGPELRRQGERVEKSGRRSDSIPPAPPPARPREGQEDHKEKQ